MYNVHNIKHLQIVQETQKSYLLYFQNAFIYRISK